MGLEKMALVIHSSIYNKMIFMNFFKRKTSWTNAEFIPFKLCIASIYVLVGSFFHDFIIRFALLFINLFVVTTLWTLILWIRKMKAGHE